MVAPVLLPVQCAEICVTALPCEREGFCKPSAAHPYRLNQLTRRLLALDPGIADVEIDEIRINGS
jgi:hypothetical protein